MNTKGIGLGLVISEKIVKEFGGKISLKSIPEPEQNHGSVFTFDIQLSSLPSIENLFNDKPPNITNDP